MVDCLTASTFYRLSRGKAHPGTYFFWRQPILEIENCTPTYSNFECQLQKAVRKGNWKYVLDRYEKLEFLFDLDNDPGERQTLAYKHPEVVRELRGLMEQWEKEVPIIQTP